jgi:hypothetical protein
MGTARLGLHLPGPMHGWLLSLCVVASICMSVPCLLSLSPLPFSSAQRPLACIILLRRPRRRPFIFTLDPAHSSRSLLHATARPLRHAHSFSNQHPHDLRSSILAIAHSFSTPPTHRHLFLTGTQDVEAGHPHNTEQRQESRCAAHSTPWCWPPLPLAKPMLPPWRLPTRTCTTMPTADMTTSSKDSPRDTDIAM